MDLIPALLIVFALLVIGRCENDVINSVATLDPISTVYLPYSYQADGDPEYGIDVGAVEQGVMDTTTMLYYGAGNSYIHVVDFNDVDNPVIIHAEPLLTVANDIEVCLPKDGSPALVGVAMEAAHPRQEGQVVIYDAYEDVIGFNIKFRITVGFKPDMLKFTSDCRQIVVANEGEGWEDTTIDDLVNPEGSVSIITLYKDPDSYLVTNLDFKSFNSKGESYAAKGVRWPYKGEISSLPSTFSQNMEPEYITFNYYDTKAYISLQENNAVAEIDLITNTIVDLHSLGTKSWSSLLLDPSDKDSGVHLQNWDIYSLRQPDAIKYFEHNNEGYLITANEGEGMEYKAGKNDWVEFERGEYFFENDLLSDLVSPDMSNNLDKEAKLGRLRLSKNEGRNQLNPSKYDNFYMFGSRGFSIFRVSDYSLVFDSGDEVERMMAVYYPEVFNGNTKPDVPDVESPEDLMDTRSDNQGPECETLEIGELNGRKLLFVGVDRSASILIYSFPSGYIEPAFESIYRAGGTGDTFDNLLAQRNLGDLDPEDLRFIAPEDNPLNKPLLLVTSTVSGTVSLYEITDKLVSNINEPENADHWITDFVQRN